MRRLVLFRHAKAERQAASGEDFDRALTERGRRDAHLIGRALAEAGVKPSLALVSASLRTRETWEASGLSSDGTEVSFERGLYNASASVLRRTVEALEDAAENAAENASGTAPETVILVGHNPALHELAVRLLIEGAASGALLDRVKGKFPTATAIVFDLDVAGRPLFAGLYIPKDYGGGAED
jgi:phosphohistidine phosphatase